MREGALTPNDGDNYSTLTLWSGVIRTGFMKDHNIWPHSRRVSAAGSFWGIEKYTAWGGDSICMEECFDSGMQTIQLSGRPLYHYRRNEASQTMTLSKETGEVREKLRYHAALLRGFLAYQLKEQYYEERKANGKASADTTVAMIVKLRRCVMQLAVLSRRRWSEGIRMLKEKDLFFAHKPPEYTFSFRKYLKTRSIKEKLTPSTYAAYFTYSLAGAIWFRFLTFFTRLKGASPKLIGKYRELKQKRLLTRGTKAS
jgi:hypothetical protein